MVSGRVGPGQGIYEKWADTLNSATPIVLPLEFPLRRPGLGLGQHIDSVILADTLTLVDSDAWLGPKHPWSEDPAKPIWTGSRKTVARMDSQKMKNDV